METTFKGLYIARTKTQNKAQQIIVPLTGIRPSKTEKRTVREAVLQCAPTIRRIKPDGDPSFIKVGLHLSNTVFTEMKN